MPTQTGESCLDRANDGCPLNKAAREVPPREGRLPSIQFSFILTVTGGGNLAMAKLKKSEEEGAVNPLRVGFLIHDVSRLRRTIYDQRLKPLGITRSQWWVLSNLSRHHGEGYMQVELARLLDVGKVTLGGLIDRLEENGLVARVPDKVDRRSKRVLPSAKGVALTKKLEVIARGVNAEIMRGITEQEHKTLLNVLSKMKHNLIEMEAVPASTVGRRVKAGAGG